MGSLLPYLKLRFLIFVSSIPEDITWELRDTCRERLIAVSPRGGYSPDLKNQKVQVWDSPVTDGLFEFTIKDANGEALLFCHSFFDIDQFCWISRQH